MEAEAGLRVPKGLGLIACGAGSRGGRMLVRRSGLTEMGRGLFWVQGVCLVVVSLGAVRRARALCGRGTP